MVSGFVKELAYGQGITYVQTLRNESFCSRKGTIRKVTIPYQNCQPMHENQFCKTHEAPNHLNWIEFTMKFGKKHANVASVFDVILC